MRPPGVGSSPKGARCSCQRGTNPGHLDRTYSIHSAPAVSSLTISPYPSNGPVERRRRAHPPQPPSSDVGRSNRMLDDPRLPNAPSSRFAGPPSMSALAVCAVGARDVRSIRPDGEEEDRQKKAEHPRTQKVDAGMATEGDQVVGGGVRVKEIVDRPCGEADGSDDRREAEDPGQNVQET